MFQMRVSIIILLMLQIGCTTAGIGPIWTKPGSWLEKTSRYSQYYEKIITRYPADPANLEAKYHLGRVYLQQNRIEDAERFLMNCQMPPLKTIGAMELEWNVSEWISPIRSRLFERFRKSNHEFRKPLSRQSKLVPRRIVQKPQTMARSNQLVPAAVTIRNEPGMDFLYFLRIGSCEVNLQEYSRLNRTDESLEH